MVEPPLTPLWLNSTTAAQKLASSFVSFVQDTRDKNLCDLLIVVSSLSVLFFDFMSAKAHLSRISTTQDYYFLEK